MKKRLLLLPLMAAFVLGGCSLDLGFIKIGGDKTQDNGGNKDDDPDTPPTPVPSVESVTISGGASELSLFGTMKLTANVVVKNGASQAVTWSSSDETVATVKDGLVTPKKVGSVTITATSKADSSKSDSVTFTIFDKGFDPTFIDQGYEYVKEFPVSAIKEFLGTGSYEIYALENLVGGAYVIEHAATSSTAAAIEVVVNDARDEEYVQILQKEGFTKIYVNSYDEYEAVDPTGKYSIGFSSTFDYETYEYVGPTTFYFYKSSDVWGSSELTSDVAWDLEKITNEDSEEIAIAQEYLTNVPFVKLGEDYEISYVEDYSEMEELIMLLQMFGLIDETTSEEEIMEWLEYFGYTGPSYYLSIHDYSIAEVFEGYATALEGAGYKFVEEYDEEYGETYSYYELNAGLESYFLNFTFGEHGNEIIVQKGSAVLDAFPTEIVNEFIENVLESENRIVAYEETEGAKFQGAIISTEYGPEFDIIMDYAAMEDLQAYALKLEQAGFEVEYDDGDGEYYPGWEATKGKLVIYFYLEQVEDEETEGYLDEGSVYFYVYADESVHETQGIYLPETMSALLALGEFDLDLEVVKLEDPTLNVVSSDPTVATVEGLTVTPLAVGETTITVSIPETTFEASVVLTVTDVSEFAVAMEDVNAWLSLNECQEVEFPDIPDAVINEQTGYDEELGSYVVLMDTSITPVEYAEELEKIGFEISEDAYGDPLATNGEIVVNVYEYYGFFVMQVFIGGEEEGAGAVFDFSEMSGTEGEMNGISFTTSKAQGQSAPAYNDGKMELRLYANNTITFECEDGLSEIFFDANTCGESKATATFASASTGTVSAVSGGFLWEGDATSVTLTVSSSGQIHINAIEVNGGGSGGGGGGSSIDVETALEEIEEITVDIAAAYLEKSASQIKVGYEDEDDVDVYVWDYSLYGFICSDFSVQASGNESSDLSKMKAALPSGATLDSYNTYEEDDYHDIWYTYGDYSIGIYYYDGDASFAVVPTEMLDIYFEMMYGE